MAMLEQDSVQDATTKQALPDTTSGSKLDVVDQLRGAQHDLEVQWDEAARAREGAQQRRDALSGKVEGLRTAQTQQQQVAVQVNQRIDARLADADSLATLDKQLSTQIAAEQAALVTKVQKVIVTGPPPPPPPVVGGGGGGSVSGGLTTVRGITVASSIAGQLASMLSAADAAGLSLGGGGYRDSAAQIALRKAHCGTSDYAIYQMPSSQCHPPTAPPGSSMHEQGLAVDFMNGGRLIQSRGDAAFQWLAANAGSFGFRNLPSEPWHWSVNGN
jgi:LAS superfamily LD-carboxypeptidase LdcB